MSTLHDANAFLRRARRTVDLLGITDHCCEEYRSRCEAIGESFCRELDLTSEQARKRPLETELPRTAEQQFQDFLKWWATVIKL